MVAIKLESGSAEAEQQSKLLRYLEARIRYCQVAPIAMKGDTAALATTKQAITDSDAAVGALK